MFGSLTITVSALLWKVIETLAMDELIKHLFCPPPMPPLDLPFMARAAGAKELIGDAFKLAYWAGVKDGLFGGVIVSLAFILLIHIWRGSHVKGVSNVLNSL